MHRWASSGAKSLRGNMFKCSYCEVTLCGKCFLTYHTVVDLQAVKKKLKIEYGCEDSDDEEKEQNSNKSLCTMIFDTTEGEKLGV